VHSNPGGSTHGFGVPLGWSWWVWSRPLQLRAVR